MGVKNVTQYSDYQAHPLFRAAKCGSMAADIQMGKLARYCKMRDFPMTSRQTNGTRTCTEFRADLLAWYDAHARDLPWRKDRDPYRVWLSEIMLQQTRVAAVIEHYQEFLRRFPTVQKLAGARDSSVLAAWSGLGYYRRARMLHAAAKLVFRERRGEFPKTSRELRDLPGIGRYTAAAIASIAFQEPVAVVDGNVERVLQRMLGKRLVAAEFWNAAEALLDRERPGDFNQAMMELGATVCTPRTPACLTCPITEHCLTRGELQTRETIPARKKKQIDLALYTRDKEVFLAQRASDASLMAAMWELPQIDGKNSRPSAPLLVVRHAITVTDYTVRIWKCDLPEQVSGRWIPVQRLSRMALTGLARKVLRKAGITASHSYRQNCRPHNRKPKSDHLNL